MNKLLTFTAAIMAVTSIYGCTDYLFQGTIDLTLPAEEEPEDETVEYPLSYTFNHPCALVSQKEIDRVKERIQDNDASDPVFASWQQLCKSSLCQSSYVPDPLEVVIRNGSANAASNNFITAAKDAAAAFQLALRWNISGEEEYAEAAMNILNSWADVCKEVTSSDNDQYLCAGFQGYTFANAAELLRSYSGWTSDDQNDFKAWLRNLWCEKNIWFLDNHGGPNTCELHYWSNWELANMASILAIGIYTEDSQLINYVYRHFREGTGSGCIKNMIPYDPVPDPDGHSAAIAQSMESGRDQGHATLVVSICAEMCQMAWNMGIDFWGTYDNKILAMCEYTAKYNCRPLGVGGYICETMPFTRYEYCQPGCGCSSSSHGAIHTEVSKDGRGSNRPCWDLIYSHYTHEKHLTAEHTYYTALYAEQLRYTSGVLTGDGGAGDSRYGTTSSAYDQLGWGTLLFYKD